MDPTPDDKADHAGQMRQAQKQRNLWLAWALVAFVVIVGVTTAIRIQQTDFSRGDRLYFSGYYDEASVEAEKRQAEADAEAALMPASDPDEVEDDK